MNLKQTILASLLVIGNLSIQAVEISFLDCIDTSECVDIQVVGLDRFRSLSHVMIYPNPSTGELHIDMGIEYNNVEFLVTDLTRKVLLHSNASHTRRIHLHCDVPAGIYLVKVMTEEGGMKTIKLMVNE